MKKKLNKYRPSSLKILSVFSSFFCEISIHIEIGCRSYPLHNNVWVGVLLYACLCIVCAFFLLPFYSNERKTMEHKKIADKFDKSNNQRHRRNVKCLGIGIGT